MEIADGLSSANEPEQAELPSDGDVKPQGSDNLILNGSNVSGKDLPIKTKKFMTSGGAVIPIDTSRFDSKQWGFGIGDVVQCPYGRAVVVGVYSDDLWFYFVSSNRVACYGGYRLEDYRREGFQLIEEGGEHKIAELFSENEQYGNGSRLFSMSVAQRSAVSGSNSSPSLQNWEDFVQAASLPDPDILTTLMGMFQRVRQPPTPHV